MISSYWYTSVAVFLWQVFLYSVVAACIYFIWSRHVRLPSGRAKRWVLCTLLIVPLVAALIPGRNSFDFREQVAWLDSMRILPIPLFAGIRFDHLVLSVAVVALAACLWQEVLPILRRPRPALSDAPEQLVRRARALPGWAGCRVGLSPDGAIFVATAGRPSLPRLIVSRGALAQLSEKELEVVLLHENAHWSKGRWLLIHFLFFLRILQCYNPVALWAFREYSIEVEIDCDADAVGGGDPKILARALLKVYESTSRSDLSARSTLRRRVDILIGKARRADENFAAGTVVLAALILMLLLPWIV